MCVHACVGAYHVCVVCVRVFAWHVRCMYANVSYFSSTLRVDHRYSRSDVFVQGTRLVETLLVNEIQTCLNLFSSLPPR